CTKCAVPQSRTILRSSSREKPGTALLFVPYMCAIVRCLRNFPPKLPAGIHRVCSSELLFHARIQAGTAGFLFPSIIRQENYDESTTSVFKFARKSVEHHRHGRGRPQRRQPRRRQGSRYRPPYRQGPVGCRIVLWLFPP